MSHSFLLVGGKPKTPWVRALQQALSALGELQILPEEKVVEVIVDNHYDVIVIDANLVRDAALLVSRIRANQDRLRVIVATASPTWQGAREVFHAGAMDYIRKSLDEQELRACIKSVLKLPLPNARH